jgi:hypothetical protein
VSVSLHLYGVFCISAAIQLLNHWPSLQSWSYENINACADPEA